MPILWDKIYYNFVNRIYPVLFNIQRNYGCNRKQRDFHIVVSLTTIPSRVEYVHLCINQLLCQTLKPDKVILWLAKDNFKDISLPLPLLKLKKRGLEIVWLNEDLNCHKKYYYAMSKYPNSIIITIDDDVYYSKKLVQKLFESYKKYPNAVSAMRVHRITLNEEGKFQSYAHWQHNYRERDAFIPTYKLMATGCGGVLYPPKVLHKDALDKQKIKTYCLSADDIWLKWMEMLNNTKVVLASKHEYAIWSIEGSQKESLNSTNVSKNGNDVYVQKMLELYPHMSVGQLLQK